MFSDNLDLENCGIITKGEAEAPKYIYEPTEQDNTVAEAIISKGNDRTYLGHWVKADYLDGGEFFDLVATWLHETSHKVAGDGQKAFNDRLMKLEQLIVDMSNADPSFGQKLRVLAQKYDEVSKKNSQNNSAYPKMTVRETEQMISDILRLVVTEAEEKAFCSGRSRSPRNRGHRRYLHDDHTFNYSCRKGKRRRNPDSGNTWNHARLPRYVVCTGYISHPHIPQKDRKANEQ